MSLQPSTKPRPRHAARRTAMRWLKRVILIAVALAIVLVHVRAWLPKPVKVEAGTATHKPLVVEVNEQGQTRVRDRFVISAPLTGTLDRIDLTPGTPVDTGTVLAQIQPSPPALLDERARREATARLAAARAHEQRAVESNRTREGRTRGGHTRREPVTRARRSRCDHRIRSRPRRRCRATRTARAGRLRGG